MKIGRVLIQVALSLGLTLFCVVSVGALLGFRSGSPIAQPIIIGWVVSSLISAWTISATIKRRMIAGIAGIGVSTLFGFIALTFSSFWSPVLAATSMYGIIFAAGLTLAVLGKIKSPQSRIAWSGDIVVIVALAAVLVLCGTMDASGLLPWIFSIVLVGSSAYLAFRSMKKIGNASATVGCVICIVLVPIVSDMFVVSTGSFYLNNHSDSK